MTTGEKIAALRREKGLSQEGLGEQLGLSRQAVSKWEADQAVPTMDNLVELSRLFGVPVDTLLRPEEELPGREQEPSEGVKISAEGLKVSYAPVLTKKTKWFIIALAALVLVSVLGNFYAMVRVQGMRAVSYTHLVPKRKSKILSDMTKGISQTEEFYQLFPCVQRFYMV